MQTGSSGLGCERVVIDLDIMKEKFTRKKKKRKKEN